MDEEIRKNFRFNYFVNVMDGAFFGFGLGFASFSTVLPLFISSMTDSAILIGLVMAVHSLGWQLPQLFMAKSIARQTQYKPMVVLLTIHERVPFLGLTLIALLLPKIGVTAGLTLTFLMLTWQGFGAGFTANPWQVMIHKVIPPDYLATFFGVQGAAANLLASGAAIIAGTILDRQPYPSNYALVFALTCVCLLISWFFIALTREPEHEVNHEEVVQNSVIRNALEILRKDRNFTWLLVSRFLSQFGVMGFNFYAVHAVKNLGASETQAGLMTSILMISQVIMNISLGWLADRWSRLNVLKIGFVAMGLSATVAWAAPSFNWFFLVMVLTGVSNTALWTIMMALTLQFGDDTNRPIYVGMANTLIAPFTISAPLIGGWLANQTGYQTTFLASILFSILAIIVLQLRVHDPREKFSNTPQSQEV